MLSTFMIWQIMYVCLTGLQITDARSNLFPGDIKYQRYFDCHLFGWVSPSEDMTKVNVNKSATHNLPYSHF